MFKRSFKRIQLAASSLLFILTLILNTAAASAAYNPNYLISDKLFTDYESMNTSAIQSFLNSKNSGLKNYTEVEDCGSPGGAHYSYYDTYYDCGVRVSAAQIINDAAKAYQISPKALLATLQKEQSLVTNPNPTQPEINCAMGYNSCDGFASFFLQVDNGAWQFRVYLELMNNRDYWGYTPSAYPCKNGRDVDSGNNFYSTGLYPGRTVTFYNPGGVAKTVTLANSATAGLYCYTPHVGPYSETGYSGSFNFVTAFELWFGSVSSPCYNDTNISGALTGQRVIASKSGGSDNIGLTASNNTSTACIEAYLWQKGNFQRWGLLTATNSPSVNPIWGRALAADTNGDGTDEMYYIDYNGHSGRVEVHGWTPSLQNWSLHTATNRIGVSSSDAEVMAADLDGDGRDNLFLVQYRNTTSGHVEIHEWAPSLQQWYNHWDIGYNAVSPKDNQVIAGDLNGDGKDELYLVQYGGTKSSRVEVHGGITGLGALTPWPYNSPIQWPVHSATISGTRIHWRGDASTFANDADAFTADSDGDGRDTFYLIQYHNTASGKVEVYGLTPDFKNWSVLSTTNQGQY